MEICKTIFNYDGPIKLSYEWLRLGDQDMKTSKGIIFTPKKYLEIANPEILRMLFLRTLPNKHISFRLEELYQLYDYYEKMENVYYNIERVSSETEEKFLKYIYPLCQTNSISTKKPLRLPFKYLTTIVQLKNILKIEEIYEKARKILKYKGFDENLPFNDFETQLNRAEKWINEIKYILKNEKNESIKRKIMNKVTIFEVPDTVSEDIKSNLSPTQKLGIKMLKMFLISNKDLIDEVIQNKIFDIAKNELKIKPQKFFKVIYLILIGKEFGPRLGPFLLMLDKVWLINRLSIE
ncbi:Lysine--tRNA ligase [subsurface metagenome]